jgi:hypothetical protein
MDIQLNKGRSILEDEERKGLLADSHEDQVVDNLSEISSTKRRKWLYGAAIGFILLLLGATFGPPLLQTVARPPPRPVADFDSQKLRSNGTHLFKKTALIVSIDGLR